MAVLWRLSVKGDKNGASIESHIAKVGRPGVGSRDGDRQDQGTGVGNRESEWEAGLDFMAACF